MTPPIAGVQYRIQSVDLETYIQVLDTAPTGGVADNVRLRPVKEDSRQYWTLQPITGSTQYHIQNVANTNLYLCNYYNSYVYMMYSCSGVSSYYTTADVSSVDNAYRIILYYSTTQFYAGPSADNTSVALSSSMNNLDGQKWNLVPVTPPPVNNHQLETGMYRIRNLNGTSLLTMPSTADNDVYARTQLDQSPYQRWAVTRQSNGAYTVLNAGTNTFLGCNLAISIPGSNLTGLPLQNPFPWDLQSVGGFAWSLRVPARDWSVGFTGYEVEDEVAVSLDLSDATASQIWFMEKYIAVGQDVIYAKCELPAGKYLLQSAHDETIYMNVKSTPWRLLPGTDTTSQFELKYNVNSASFTLTYVTNSGTPIINDAGGYLAINSPGQSTSFVLLEKDAGDPGYFICRPDSGHPRKVISARTTTVSGNTVFTVEKMTEGDPQHMWILQAV
jgi:hypothetical protein